VIILLPGKSFVKMELKIWKRHWTLDEKGSVVYTENVEESKDIGLQSFFNLLSYAIKKRKPNIEGSIPTFADLEADVQELWASQTPVAPPEIEEAQPGAPESSERAQAIPTGCVPCSIGHLGTCSGLLNEAMRFARDGGVSSNEVLTRVNMCLDELNTMERVDLRPEMIYGLPDWEKGLADKALELSRTLRHDLEGLSSVPELEGIAAKTQGTRQEIGTSWMRERLTRMTPEQRSMAEELIKQKIAEQSK